MKSPELNRYNLNHLRDENALMRRGLISPKPRIFDLTQTGEHTQMSFALQAVMGDHIPKFGNRAYERTIERAINTNIYDDQSAIFAEDLLSLRGYKDKDGDSDRRQSEIEKLITDEEFVIVQLPWKREDSFRRIPREETFNEITQSREIGITKDNTRDGLNNDRFLDLGAGVAGRIFMGQVSVGAKHITLVDGGIIKPHRGNRVQGPFISSIGENQAVYYVKQGYDINPYGDFTAIPKFAGDPSANPDEVSLEGLIDTHDFVIDGMDQLVKKSETHVKAQEKGKPVVQITDAGSGIIVLFDAPHTEFYPFYGRLDPSVHEKVANLPEEEFIPVAKTIFMGQDNITEEFEEAFEITENAGYSHIPQSGRAATKAAGYAVDVYAWWKEGQIEVPYEAVFT
jgi:hypothetical protein